MKKAGIITHYDVHNHGACLQLFALAKQLEIYGFSAHALQFHKNYDFMNYEDADKKYNISLKSIPYYLAYTKINGVNKTVYNYQKRRILSNFRKKHDLVGEFYSKATDLDVVVIGSDEIFSIEAGPNPWYYGIGVPCKKQFSYAASFGPTTLDLIDKKNVRSLIEGGLKNLDTIMVRDANSAELVKILTGREAAIVCDPVLMYNFGEYVSEKSSKDFRKHTTKKYCIVYSYDYNMNDANTVSYIRTFACKHDLKIYSVGYFHKWCDENVNVDPIELLEWFSNAEMVFTDTFHGSVISLTMRTQFISKVRGNKNKLSFLLSQYGVEDRETIDFSDIDRAYNNPIDYSNISFTIEEIANKSREKLRKALME